DRARLEEWQEPHVEARSLLVAGTDHRPHVVGPRRETAVDILVIVAGQGELLQVVGALNPPRGLPSRLHRREQQRDQDRNDCDDDEELDQRETTPPMKFMNGHVHEALLLARDASGKEERSRKLEFEWNDGGGSARIGS